MGIEIDDYLYENPDSIFDESGTASEGLDLSLHTLRLTDELPDKEKRQTGSSAFDQRWKEDLFDGGLDKSGTATEDGLGGNKGGLVKVLYTEMTELGKKFKNNITEIWNNQEDHAGFIIAVALALSAAEFIYFDHVETRQHELHQQVQHPEETKVPEKVLESSHKNPSHSKEHSALRPSERERMMGIQARRVVAAQFSKMCRPG